MRSIGVFCGSRVGARPDYRDSASELGRILAERKITLVYGGGSVGLMGILAESVLANGGEAIGVIPKALCGKEGPLEGLTNVRIVTSMHERKALMLELSDGFIAMPGGIGTLDELFEVWTWRRLGLHKKPFGLLNVSRYYEPLITLLDYVVSQKFLSEGDRSTILIEESAQKLVNRLEAYHPA